MSKFAEANEKIAQKVTNGYKNIENGVVEGYKKIENGVVEGFEKISDRCIKTFFAKDGESVRDAKERLGGKQNETKEEKTDDQADA